MARPEKARLGEAPEHSLLFSELFMGFLALQKSAGYKQEPVFIESVTVKRQRQVVLIALKQFNSIRNFTYLVSNASTLFLRGAAPFLMERIFQCGANRGEDGIQAGFLKKLVRRPTGKSIKRSFTRSNILTTFFPALMRAH